MALVLTTSKDKPAPEKEVLFSIDGMEYEIPTKFGANAALQFARVVRLQGPDIAVAWVLEYALGPSGYAALMNYDELTAEQLDQVTQVIVTRVAGAMELPKAGLRAV